MSNYTLYTGGPYKQNNGSAITASSTVINNGSAKNVSGSDNLVRSEWFSDKFPGLVGGVDGVSPADIQTVGVTIDSVTQSSGLCLLTYASAHGLVAGDIVVMGDTTFPRLVYRIIRVPSATTVVINEAYTSTLGALADITSYKIVGSFAIDTFGNYIMKLNDATVHGQAETLLRSGAADYGRSKVHKTNAVRTEKVATAIRNNTYNVVTGEFSSAPSTSNDFASMDVDGSNVPDDEAKATSPKREVGGEFTVRDGSANPVTKEYQAKTN